VALEDAPGLLLGVPARARIGVDALGARLAAQLGDRHPVKDRVHRRSSEDVGLVDDP